MGKKTFLGVSSKARKVKKIFLGVGGKAHRVKKGYIGVAGKAHQFYTLGSTDSGVYVHDSYDHHRFCKVDPYTLTILSSISYSGSLVNSDGISNIKTICPCEGTLIVASLDTNKDPYRLSEISANTGVIIRSIKGTSNIASTNNPFGYMKNSTQTYGYDVVQGGTGSKIFQSFLPVELDNTTNTGYGSVSAFDKDTFALISAGVKNVTVNAGDTAKLTGSITAENPNIWIVQRWREDREYNYVTAAKYSSNTWARIKTRYWGTNMDSYASMTTYVFSNLPGTNNILQHQYYNQNEGILYIFDSSFVQISKASIPWELYWAQYVFSIN